MRICLDFIYNVDLPRNSIKFEASNDSSNFNLSKQHIYYALEIRCPFGTIKKIKARI